MEIKRIEMLNKKDIVKQIIYVKNIDDNYIEDIGEEIIKTMALVNNEEYFKLDPSGIPGAESIKNSQNIWCDSGHNIWQVCCGQAKDINNNDIPNCWYIRIIGEWFN